MSILPMKSPSIFNPRMDGMGDFNVYVFNSVLDFPTSMTYEMDGDLGNFLTSPELS